MDGQNKVSRFYGFYALFDCPPNSSGNVDATRWNPHFH